MSRSRIFYLLFFIAQWSFSQKVELVHRSDFRHDYVVGQFVYIESAADTVRLKYIATLKIHADNFPFIISGFTERFKTEGKDLGANSFRVDKYEEIDSAVTLTIKTYFAPEKFFAENEKKRDKEKIYVFSSERQNGFDQSFYLNDSLSSFASTKYLCLRPVPGEYVKIRVKKKPLMPRAKPDKGSKFKGGKDSKFAIVGERLPDKDGLIVGVMFGLTGYLIYAAVKTDKNYGFIDYEVGRPLLDIYLQQIK